MAEAYENYATACRLHVAAHNAYVAQLRKNGYRHATDAARKGVRLDFAGLKVGTLTKALNRAAKASMLREDAKAQYRQARIAAERAAGRR